MEAEISKKTLLSLLIPIPPSNPSRAASNRFKRTPPKPRSWCSDLKIQPSVEIELRVQSNGHGLMFFG
ncbi:hypothetical protein COLO4_22357 [Corchorus olitorius]|uniref:Uncharacterized protein n=1 Tax=Corchorus olitorius TaxID=93759 RepID=A0A1R3IMM0_9ROSI|nr:hypothetical protein COLO4_22357 [Corchorus olitorius]